jgi:O-antigen/teichoic acid export membrane protein
MIWIALSQIITTILSAATLPALTKSFSTASYGIWTQINVTTGLIVPVLTLQFGNAVVRFLAGENDKTTRRRSLGAMFCAILIFSIILFIPIGIFAPQLSNFLFNNTSYVHFVYLTFLWTFIEGLTGFFISYLRARGQMLTLSIIQVLFSVSHLVLIVVLATLGFGLERIIIWLIFVDSLFTIGTLCIIVRLEGFPTPNFTRMKTFLLFSIPQVPTGLLIWIIASSDRFFITHFLSLSETGIYSSSDLLGGIIILLYFPIIFVLLPAVSKAWEQNRRDSVRIYFEYSIKLFLTLAIPAAVGLSILSQPILRIITSSDYLAGWQLVLLVSIGTIFSGLFQINSYIIYLVEKTPWITLIALIAAIISVTLNYVLIPRIGIIGCAISTVVSYFTLSTIIFILTRQIVKYNINFIYWGKVVIATLIMALLLFFVKVHSILGIISAIVGGAIIFGLVMFLLGAFSKQDKRLIKETLVGLIPWVH